MFSRAGLSPGQGGSASQVFVSLWSQLSLALCLGEALLSQKGALFIPGFPPQREPGRDGE